MKAEIRELVEKLHSTPDMAVVAASGAGAQAITWLLAVAGASRTVLEAVVPYAASSFTEFLGYEPEQFVATQTARDMARAAYRRAVHLREPGVPVAGVACTATIATDRPKRGEHRCHVAAYTAQGVNVYSLQFVKGLRDRAGEDDIASRLALIALAEACGVERGVSLALDEAERVEVERVRYADPIQAMLAGHVTTVLINPDGTMAADARVSGGILSGSFNPLHEGHEKLADAASRILGADVTFELSITNVDKPRLEESEIRRRVAQFRGKRPVVISEALVFYRKARLFPGCAFVIGYDTAVRIVDPKYYGGQQSKMLLALEELRGLGCRFLVAGRKDGGAFHTLDEVAVPEGFEDMFSAIPESEFRVDLSSTELRMAR
ncbi:MAG: hypothetical protein L0177_01130 [Chloroflexi bacterium]|nr:hypothetical protein [Chloroflexota bacterium]